MTKDTEFVYEWRAKGWVAAAAIVYVLTNLVLLPLMVAAYGLMLLIRP